jgi:hypothetical protein
MRKSESYVVKVLFTTSFPLLLKNTHFLLDKILELGYNVVKCNFNQLIQH